MAAGVEQEVVAQQNSDSAKGSTPRKGRKPRTAKPADLNLKANQPADSIPLAKAASTPVAALEQMAPAPLPPKLPEGRCVTQTLRDLLASQASEVPPFARLAEDLGLAAEENTVLRIYATSALYQAALGKTTVWQDINNRVEGKPGEREAEEPGGFSFIIHEAAAEPSTEDSGL